ncbi:MAG: intradiol ring-cleavage dioxygenase [Dehalococcoidia bacterium]|nr:intradiol ring-cleavage dioxygenase [Dehalococcoidia bacterium]
MNLKSMTDDHDDDRPIGRVLSRREVLTLVGGLGALAAGGGVIAQRALAASSRTVHPVAGAAQIDLPTCIVRPAQTEGPYFRDVRLNRSDIRSDPTTGVTPDGAPLTLIVRVSDVSSNWCAPLPDVMVDVWHCDALGVYSGVNDRLAFCRGYQMTDETGTATFQTIYPGWYPGRTVHIHFKIRTDPDAPRGYDFTSQIYFDDTLSDEIFRAAPYTSNRNRRLRNAQDSIYRGGGEQLLAPVTADDLGYTAVFTIGLDRS